MPEYFEKLMTEPLFFVAHTLGFCALFFYVLSGQMQSSKMIMRMNGVATAIMSIHFLMLSAPVAAVTVIFASVRSLLMSTDKGRRYKYPVILACLFISIGFGIYSAQAWWMMICIGGPLVWSYAELDGTEKKMRPLGMLSESFWLFNNMMVFSIGGVVSNLMVISSYGAAMFRYAPQPVYVYSKPVVQKF